MAGYSGTPLPRKLGLGPGARLGLVHAPPDFATTLGPVPEGVQSADAARRRGPFDVMVCFVRTRAELAQLFPRWRAKLAVTGGLWIAWPKKTRQKTLPPPEPRPSDLSENDVRELGLATGLVDNKVCAIDETWSGLRFVVRLADRPARSR